jgi:hypothetical protein
MDIPLTGLISVTLDVSGKLLFEGGDEFSSRESGFGESYFRSFWRYGF